MLGTGISQVLGRNVLVGPCTYTLTFTYTSSGAEKSVGESECAGAGASEMLLTADKIFHCLTAPDQ